MARPCSPTQMNAVKEWARYWRLVVMAAYVLGQNAWPLLATRGETTVGSRDPLLSQSAWATGFRGSSLTQRSHPIAIARAAMGAEVEARKEREWNQLTEQEANVLLLELRAPDDDCVVILRVIPTWVQLHGQPLADEVIEAIARFEMAAQQRRDDIHPGCLGWLFRFLDGGQLTRCQDFVWDVPRFRSAFAHGPRAIANGTLAPGAHWPVLPCSSSEALARPRVCPSPSSICKLENQMRGTDNYQPL